MQHELGRVLCCNSILKIRSNYTIHTDKYISEVVKWLVSYIYTYADI